MTTPATDYHTLSIPELKELCRGRGLRVSGRLDDLDEAAAEYATAARRALGG